eukprot:7445788-Pyramimonas_sp.AAC.1
MRGRPHPNQRPHRTLIGCYATHPPPSPCRLRAKRAQLGRVERKKLNREGLGRVASRWMGRL